MAESKRVYRIGKRTESFNINSLLSAGEIRNELDYERAMVADRKLRLMSKQDPEFKQTRIRLRELIHAYENKYWKDGQDLGTSKLKSSDRAEDWAEREREFIDARKHLIKNKLKALNVTQQQLGELLGHRSKTHMSELMNGITPFSLKDLNVIRLLLKIPIDKLIPGFLPVEEYPRIITAVRKLNNPKLRAVEKYFRYFR